MLQSSWQDPTIIHTLFKESIMCIYYITGTCWLGILLFFLHKVCNLQRRGKTLLSVLIQLMRPGNSQFIVNVYFIVGFYDFVVR